VTGDLSRRRGQIESQDMNDTGDMAEVVALVPLRELFTYANEVRSLSQGPGGDGDGAAQLRPGPGRGAAAN
jgi:elongation factor G